MHDAEFLGWSVGSRRAFGKTKERIERLAVGLRSKPTLVVKVPDGEHERLANFSAKPSIGHPMLPECCI